MSFKRDGDDFALLRNLKRRRVSDLLVGHIPEDEALLLKNGRYTCTVCSYRPIFDTIETLSLHRKGKRHLNNLTRHLAQQHELLLLKQKKEHKAFIETGSTKLSGEKYCFLHMEKE
ncbi:sodium channel modifier 1-like [Limulus polyphemus]|uniref:Sodium channel modifier 1-like n=1 Tax=Limulus polyphemus TaxID=6850 RepID=A0ABM1SVV7_LIMPO|nr:sodium channel modifier 1-like [Limulus polyphemus]